jgi:hypothetical protein
MEHLADLDPAGGELLPRGLASIVCCPAASVVGALVSWTLLISTSVGPPGGSITSLSKPLGDNASRECKNRSVFGSGGVALIQQRLTARVQRKLVIGAECGDAEASRSLIEAFLPAIAQLARGFQGSRVERRELLQEGVAGLLFAARRYRTSATSSSSRRRTPRVPLPVRRLERDGS